jgi:hypothetical protein
VYIIRKAKEAEMDRAFSKHGDKRNSHRVSAGKEKEKNT